jgi:hypothetical protein
MDAHPPKRGASRMWGLSREATKVVVFPGMRMS